MHLKRILFSGAIALATAAAAIGQTATMPPQTSSFTGNTRGYWFTSPVDMTITGVNVLQGVGGANTEQNFAVVRFDGATPPPAYPTTTNAFTQLALGQDLPAGAFQPVSARVLAGDVIGIYGNTTAGAGTTNGTNSYAGGSQVQTMIDGNVVDLYRSGMQFHLGSATTPAGMQDLWSEPNSFNITRVEFTYELDDVVITDCLPGSFVDISATGTPLGLTDDGEADISTTVSNALFAAGLARVGSNGGVRFNGAGTNLGFGNAAIPSTNAFSGDQTLLPFWDDVNTVGGTIGDIFWEEIGGTLIVQWNNVGFFQDAINTATWQLQVHSSGPAFAQFIYTDIEGLRADGGASATIGYQGGASASTDAQYTIDAPLAVRNGTVLSLVRARSTVFTPDAPGTWVDISGTGTPLSLTDDGEADIPTTVSNGLFAAGFARVGSNGGVRFGGAGLDLGFSNVAIPSTNAFSGDQTLLPFWDDVNTSSGTIGEIFWQEIGGTLIVQWNNVGFYQDAVNTATWQLQVHSSGPIFAQFLYQDIEGPRAAGGSSATIGYQGGAISGDAPWSFNTTSVSNGTVLSLVAASRKIGASYCNANPNSTGVPGEIHLSGTRSVATNNLRLTATNLPTNAFGYFIASTTTGFVANAGGQNGNLCLSGTIGRAVGGAVLSSGGAGSFTILANLASIPQPGGPNVAAMAGESWNFQCWHRDSVGGVANSNLTNAVQVVFIP
ncbi:MAG: hypothetical protein R3F49_03145 [Planctomycetota bacterium]